MNDLSVEALCKQLPDGAFFEGYSMTAAIAASIAERSALPDIDALLINAREASEFLKAISHEARLVILCLLIDGEKSVSELEQVLSLRQPAVSQQLARLRADNLVEARRDGKNIYYSLARPEVIDLVHVLQRTFCKI